MKECAYPLGGMKWLAGLIALLVIALIVTVATVAYVDPRPVGLSVVNSSRESMGTVYPDGPGIPRKYTSVASDTSYQSKSRIEKRIASMSIVEALPYFLGIVVTLTLLVSMVVLGVRRLRRRHA